MGLIRAKQIWAIAVCLLISCPVMGATLSPVPPPVVISGSDALSNQTIWGSPGPFWVVPLVEWEQTAEVRLSISVSSFPGEPDLPTLHTVFLNARNSTPDLWERFDIEVEGPATFASIPPPSIALASPATIHLTDQSLVFDDLAWTGFAPGQGVGLTAPIGLALNVTPSATVQPVILTFRPTSAPEPGTSLILGAGCFWLACRRCSGGRGRS